MMMPEQFRSELPPEDLRLALAKIALVAGQTSGTLAFLLKQGHMKGIEDEFGPQFVSDLLASSDRMLALITELIGPTVEDVGKADD